MPDTPVAPTSGEPYNSPIVIRVSRLEEEMREAKAARSDIEAVLLRIEAILPHLATKQDIGDLRVDIARVEGKTELAAQRAEQAADKADQAIARADQAVVKADQAIVKADQIAARVDQVTARVDQIAAKADQISARADQAIARVEVTAVKAGLAASRVDGMQSDLAQIRADVTHIEVALADKPSKLYMWGILTALLTAYACGLAALAVLK